jgi:hypothetical protein
MPHPLSGFVSCVPPSGLGRCRVGSGSQPVSDGMSEFGGFLDRDMLVLWLFSHQWIVCVLSVGPGDVGEGDFPLPGRVFFRIEELW